jgi:hypothetical protein
MITDWGWEIVAFGVIGTLAIGWVGRRGIGA